MYTNQINQNTLIHFFDVQTNISSLRPMADSFDELDIKDGVEELTINGLRSRELYGFVNSQLLVSVIVALVENWRPYVSVSLYYHRLYSVIM